MTDQNNQQKQQADDQPKKRDWKKIAKKGGIWTIVFFTVKGIITSSLIIGAAFGVRGCFTSEKEEVISKTEEQSYLIIHQQSD